MDARNEWASLPMPRRDVLTAGTALLLATRLGAAPMTVVPTAAHGFDFLLGSWSVKHRRLKKRLVQNTEWEEFPGTLDVRPILHGLGNVDENVLDTPAGRYLATSLRVFEPQSALWSVYWIDGRTAGIDKPVIGKFEGNIGQFYNDDLLGDRPIKVRFTYRDLGPRKANWDQAFSADGGHTWEVNWTMDFTRTGGRA